jgi:cyclohexanecarboxylate-CoA ligase
MAALEDRGVTQTASVSSLVGDASLAEHYRRAGWWPGEPLADRFERLVRADAGRRAVADDSGAVLTRGELWTRAAALGRSLTSSGVRRGDAVLIYLPNSVEWQVVFLATLQIGAVPATLPVSSDAATVRHVYELIGARAVVAARTHRRRPTGDWACQAASAGGRAATVLLLDDGADIWRRLPGEVAAPVVPAGVNHLMFTSSTTGMPKAVMHTDDTLAAANLAFMQRFGLGEDTPIFMPSPLGHSVGAWHGARLSLFSGATLVLQDAWDPVRGLELVEEHGCVFTSAATPFLKDIVDAEWPTGQPKLESLRTFLCGGAPVPPSLLEQALEQAPHTFVTVLWGMTEGTGTTCTPDSTREQLTLTAGAPVPELELTILEPDSRGVGELAMRGPQVFVGYLGQEELYRSLVTEDGFFRTGDLAAIGDDGYVRLTGRLKDIIIRGGVNISPVPIEDAIAAHPAVRRIAVVGEPDDRLGERICAVIVPKGAPPTLEELNAWLVEQGLSTRKLPESLRIVDEMPVTAAGKIRKVDLRRTIEEEA